MVQDQEIHDLKSKMDEMAEEFGEMLRVRMHCTLLLSCIALSKRLHNMQLRHVGSYHIVAVHLYVGNAGEDAREDRDLEQQLRGPRSAHPAAHGGAQGLRPVRDIAGASCTVQCTTYARFALRVSRSVVDVA